MAAVSNQINLLRMLEPAVRPGNTPAPVQPVETPFEQRDFQSQLDDARVEVATDGDPITPVNVSNQATKVAPAVQPIESLRQVGIIENESLRQLLSTFQPATAVND